MAEPADPYDALAAQLPDEEAPPPPPAAEEASPLDALAAQLPDEEEASPLDALAAQLPDEVEAAPVPTPEEEAEARELALDENTRGLYKLTREIPLDDYALAERIADRTGLEPRAAWKQIRQLRQDMDVADLKPREWRKAHPYLDALVQENPRKGALFMADEKMSAVTEKFRQAGVLGAYVLRSQWEVMKRVPEYLAGTGELPAPFEPKELDVTQQVLQEKSPLAQAEGFERLQIYGDVFSRARAAEEVSKKYYEAWQAGEAGNEAEETRLLQEASSMQRKLVSQDYDAGPWERIFVDAVNVAGSVAGSLQAAGTGAVVGGAGGAAVGSLLGPGGTAVGAKLGATAGAGFGVLAHSTEAETGGGFQSFLEARTDEGKLVSRQTARHGAYVYGIVAPVVETLSFQKVAKTLGIGGEVLTGATFKAAMVEAMKKPAFRSFLKSVVEGAASEAGEEGVQALAEKVVGYFIRSKEAGALQTPDIRGGAVEVFGAVGTALSGSLLLGAGTGTVNVTSTAVAQRFMEEKQQKSDTNVATLVEAADTPSAQAAPREAAELLARMTAARGAPVTHVQVTPQALAQYFQTAANPQAAATALLGEDAQETLRLALAANERVEVPTEAILAMGKDAARLLPDMADSSEVSTGREAAARKAATEAQAQALATAAQKEAGLEPDSEAEAALVDTVQQQLKAHGYSTANARLLTTPMRLFLRTQAIRNQKPVDEIVPWRMFTRRLGKGPTGGLSVEAWIAKELNVPLAQVGEVSAPLTQQEAQAAPQEGPRNLLVQHNLREEGLLHLDELGGIPAPSLAVSRKEHPLEGFGEVTLSGAERTRRARGGYAHLRRGCLLPAVACSPPPNGRRGRPDAEDVAGALRRAGGWDGGLHQHHRNQPRQSAPGETGQQPRLQALADARLP